MTLLLRQVDLPGGVQDVRVSADVVVQVGHLPRLPGEAVVEARGGALLPGLHDHHLHLFATAAASSSVDVKQGLDPLRLPGDGWVRAIGWSGDGDRWTLDAVQATRPARVQHRSGALWVLNSVAVSALDLEHVAHPGVERDARGVPTGRLWRADDLVADLVGRDVPDLRQLCLDLFAFGVTGVTDATPDLDDSSVALLRERVSQRLLLLGDPDGTGPVKLVLPDSNLPTYDELVAWLRAARPRPVAVHSVTRVALVLLLAALGEVGQLSGDRVEHASVVPAELCGGLPPVVTQPGFLADRGHDYLQDVPAEEHQDLYRYASILAAGGVAVPSSDAPHGPLDPWQVLVAARDRRVPGGRVLGASERVAVEVALDGLLRPLADLRAAPRRVVPGAAADLVLLHVPRSEALRRPDAAHVRSTWLAGGLVHGQEDS